MNKIIHTMKLEPSPFEKIKNGNKTIEIRLNDEKRQLIKIGDIIGFSLATDQTQVINTEVIGLDKFSTFREMFASYSPHEYGCKNQNEWNQMYKYYSPEDEKKYGCLAIRIKTYKYYSM